MKIYNHFLQKVYCALEKFVPFEEGMETLHQDKLVSVVRVWTVACRNWFPDGLV